MVCNFIFNCVTVKTENSKFLLTNSRVPISCYSSGPFLSLYQCGFICCLCVQPLHLPVMAFFSLGKCAIYMSMLQIFYLLYLILKVPITQNFIFSYLKLYLTKITFVKKFCHFNKTRFFNQFLKSTFLRYTRKKRVFLKQKNLPELLMFSCR